MAGDSRRPLTARRRGLTPAQIADAQLSFRDDLLEDQVIVVSGGGSGIGRAIAFLAARLGAQVVICGRDRERLQRAVDDLRALTGRDAALRPLTIRDPDQVEAFADHVIDQFGRVTTLVNNAGGQYPQDAIDFTSKGWRAVVDTNLNGTWWMMQAFARRWRDRKESGHIINMIASVRRGAPQSAHTAAARSGVIGLSRTVAVEWAPLNIRVNCVAPGQIESDGLVRYPDELMARFGQGNPMRRAGTTLEIAEAVIYLTSPSTRFVNGEILHVDGGAQLWGSTWPLGVPDHFRAP